MNILASLIAPVANFFTSRNEIKVKADAAKAGIALAKQNGETQHTLNRDEWEALSKQAKTLGNAEVALIKAELPL